ncbi:hypothetical protein GCM10009672_26270 [Nesterenkonia lutea]
MRQYSAPLTSDLARAARALTQVSVEEISEAAALDPALVRDFEHRGSPLPADANKRLRAALEEFGAVIFAEDDFGGRGVRHKYTAAKTRQLNRWEGEGGPAFGDHT